MKRILTLALVLISTVAFAANKKAQRPNPCLLIEKACKDGGIDPKWLYRDCLQHILAGHDVPGVSLGGISSGQVESCKNFKAMQRGK